MVWGVRYAEVNCITAIVQSVEGRGRASCKALTLCVGLYDITGRQIINLRYKLQILKQILKEDHEGYS